MRLQPSFLRCILCDNGAFGECRACRMCGHGGHTAHIKVREDRDRIIPLGESSLCCPQLMCLLKPNAQVLSHLDIKLTTHLLPLRCRSARTCRCGSRDTKCARYAPAVAWKRMIRGMCWIQTLAFSKII